ncbi:MAG: hypothetical protein KAH56_10490 [Candidatus Krumholzibacteria bacterium]|nr:hypothetical protein [Candidatus Krumholzibacteria bacterium]
MFVPVLPAIDLPDELRPYLLKSLGDDKYQVFVLNDDGPIEVYENDRLRTYDDAFDYARDMARREQCDTWLICEQGFHIHYEPITGIANQQIPPDRGLVTSLDSDARVDQNRDNLMDELGCPLCCGEIMKGQYYVEILEPRSGIEIREYAAVIRGSALDRGLAGGWHGIENFGRETNRRIETDGSLVAIEAESEEDLVIVAKWLDARGMQCEKSPSDYFLTFSGDMLRIRKAGLLGAGVKVDSPMEKVIRSHIDNDIQVMVKSRGEIRMYLYIRPEGEGVYLSDIT